MELDDDICYCQHVSLRTLLDFARRTRPADASQMAACAGAGTGCGWCVRVLRKIVASLDQSEQFALSISPEQYAAARDAYRADLDIRNASDND